MKRRDTTYTRREANANGATILELLVSIALFSTTFGSALALLHTTQNIRSRVKHQAAEEYGNARAKASMRQIVRDADTHRLPAPFRIHPPGLLSFSDGSSHPYFLSSSRQRSGDAVTGYALLLGNSFSVTRLISEGTTSILEGCRGSPPTESLSSFGTYLVMSVDGESEMVGTGELQTDRCAHFTLRKERSVSFNQTALAPYSVIIPIIRHYTYFVDGAGTLRYISHQGEGILENQPVADDVTPLSLSYRLDAPVPTLIYTQPQQGSVEFSVLLQRIPHYDHLIQLYER